MFSKKGLLTMAAMSVLAMPALAGGMGGTGEDGSYTADTGTMGSPEQQGTQETPMGGDTMPQEMTESEAAEAIVSEMDFAELDMNQDGNVTQNEFAANSALQEPEQIFSSIDENEDGIVTEKEFDNFQQMNSEGTAEEEDGGWFQ